MSVKSSSKQTTAATLQYAGWLIAFLLLILAGYRGFRAFATTPDLSIFNLYTLAVVAGVASFFSPCAFPILPSYFSFNQTAAEDMTASSSSAIRVIRLGVAAALGVITFDLLLGVGIAVLGSSAAKSLSISGPEPSLFVRYFRGGVGAVLLTLGTGQIFGWNLKPRFVDSFAYRTRPERDGRRSPVLNLYLYGLGYNAAGMGCTGPILAGLIIFALTSGGASLALTAFLIFSLTMGTLMLVVSGLVAASHQTLITRLKAATPKIKDFASVLLIAVGVFNVYSAINLNLFLRLLFP